MKPTGITYKGTELAEMSKRDLIRAVKTLLDMHDETVKQKNDIVKLMQETYERKA